MKAKHCKITVGGIEVEGMGSWSFDTFESDEERDKFRKETDEIYVEHYREMIKQEKGNGQSKKADSLEDIARHKRQEPGTEERTKTDDKDTEST